MTTRLCIVRHGETDWNAEKRIQGQTDIPLNETGRAQALATAFGLAHHAFAALYASDLGRAMQTAAAASARLGLEVQTLAGLRERHYGVMQGQTVEETAVSHPAVHRCYAARDPHGDLEGGESLECFALRVMDCLNALVRHHAGHTVLAVAHGGVLDIVYRQASGRALAAPRDFVIPNCALNWFTIDAHGWHVDHWADRRHLEHVLEQVVE